MRSADVSRSPTIRHAHLAAARPPVAANPPGRSPADRIGPALLVLSADALALLSPLLTDARQLSATVAMAGCSLVLLATGGRYRERLHLSALDDLPAIASRLLVATAGVATLVGLRGGPPAVATFLENCATAAVLLVAGRAATMRLIRWRRERGCGVRRTLMMGGGPLAAELADVLDNHPGYGLAVAGFVDDDRDHPASDVVPWLGRLSDVDSVARNIGADVLIVTPDAGTECALLDLLRTPQCLTCDVFAVPRLYHLHIHPTPIDRIGPVPVVRVLAPNLSRPWRAIRRAVDAGVCGLALAVLLPFVGASRRHRGRLWTVLRGGMSLIGPHPDRPDHIASVSNRYECYRLRGRARAGLTGLAQISAMNGHVSTHDRARYDNYYIENWSLWLDVKIIVTAVAHAIGRR